MYTYTLHYVHWHVHVHVCMSLIRTACIIMIPLIKESTPLAVHQLGKEIL